MPWQLLVGMGISATLVAVPLVHLIRAHDLRDATLSEGGREMAARLREAHPELSTR